LHIWIINEWVEKIGGLDERETAVAQRRDRRIHSDPDFRVREVQVLVLFVFVQVAVVVQSLQEFQ